MTLRALISATIARRGLVKKDLAAKVPALGKLPQDAASNLSRYLAGRRDVHGETAGELIAALDGVVCCRHCRADLVDCRCGAQSH